ncbi:hypothetical protein FRX31_003651 [Thalictrum thalictroides]|uniref:PWWP domain-containing protein n=1 Tax=Thalictrum thalictroides TaxID=46969 RepID=A0A7J6XEE2_THATH|nr:hypothetical protein FRX31_003651 [Thalictrum thalictroides]
MRSKRLENTRNHCNKVAEEVSHEVKSRRGLMTGDVVWVRIRGSLWWPAQVVDENMVSRSSKPKTKVLDQVLVRLYGTYAYLYRDPVNDRAELNKILKENNGSYLETFKKALEQDLSHRKPSKLKRSGCEPTENGGVETPKDKKSKHEANIVNDKKLNSPSSVTPLKGSPELSARRIRVMQGLGLVAPRGSPFQKK